VGIIGVIVCVIAIAGVIMGSGWIGDRVDAVATGAVEALDRAIAVGQSGRGGTRPGRGTDHGAAHVG
jgi:hypothetical protein